MSDPSYSLLGARAILDQVQAVIKLAPGVKKSRKRAKIHRMRVATRRLRAAFSVFNEVIDIKAARQWRKQVRRTTRTLSSARDLDVQLDQIEALIDQLEDQRLRPGVERLHLRLTQQRRRLQPKVVRAMKRLEGSGVLDEMGDFLRNIIVESGLASPDEKSVYAYEQAYRNVMMRAEQLLAFDPYVSQPECVEQMHDMRIAAKRLRYSIELFEPIYDGRLKPYRKKIRDLQDQLGELHDTDIWLEMLPQFVSEEHERTREYYGHDRAFGRLRRGLDWLIEQKKADRQRIYENVVALWGLMKNEDLWDRLRREVREPIEQYELATNPAPSSGQTDQQKPVVSDHIEGPSGLLRDPDEGGTV